MNIPQYFLRTFPWFYTLFDGYFDGNTLVIDDSPYKAFVNPPNTSLFSPTFNYKNAFIGFKRVG